jgi:hypothetical protein
MNTEICIRCADCERELTIEGEDWLRQPPGRYEIVVCRCECQDQWIQEQWAKDEAREGNKA